MVREGGGGRVEELRASVDAAQARVARLARGVEEREASLEEARLRADALEEELCSGTVRSPGFLDLVKDKAVSAFDVAPFLWVLLPLVVIVGAFVECVAGGEEGPYRFDAMGSALESELPGAPPGARCDVEIAEAAGPPPGDDLARCTAVVRCDETVFDGEVACRIYEHVETDSDGDTTTTELLEVTRSLAGPSDVALKEGDGTLTVRHADDAALQVILHRWDSEGEL